MLKVLSVAFDSGDDRHLRCNRTIIVRQQADLAAEACAGRPRHGNQYGSQEAEAEDRQQNGKVGRRTVAQHLGGVLRGPVEVEVVVQLDQQLRGSWGREPAWLNRSTEALTWGRPFENQRTAAKKPHVWISSSR
eukprot:4661750-Prymnesium_polylepis.2